MKIVEGAGHYPHQENPEDFNNAVLRYLKVRKTSCKLEDKIGGPKQGLMDRMFGAVSTTVKLGNSVIDSVQKRTNGVVGSIYRVTSD